MAKTSAEKEFYPTPDWCTHALMKNEAFVGGIHEPACGNGCMAEIIKQYTKEKVVSSDLYDYGYKDAIEGPNDFLDCAYTCANNIITNPPFSLAQEFVERGLELVSGKVALLLRLAFLEGGKRYKSLFAKLPPARVWVFSERITFYPDGIQTAGSGTLAYGWFVWEYGHDGRTELKWLPPEYKHA